MDKVQWSLDGRAYWLLAFLSDSVIASESASVDMAQKFGPIVALAALVVSVIAFGRTVWADRRSRECEFRYTMYEKLIELSRMIDAENRELQAEINQLRQEGVDLNQPDPLGKALTRQMDSITIHCREISLRRTAFSDSDICRLTKIEASLRAKFQCLDQQRENNAAEASDVLNFAKATQAAWETMAQVVESTTQEMAEAIKSRCS